MLLPSMARSVFALAVSVAMSPLWPILLVGIVAPAAGPEFVAASEQQHHRHRHHHRHLSAAWSSLFDVPGHPLNNAHHRRHNNPAAASGTAPHAPAGCPSCGMRRAMAEQSVPSPELTALRIEFVKEQILKKLRLKEPPIVTKPVSALPKALAVSNTLSSADMLQQKEDNNEDTFYGRTDQVILFPSNDDGRGCPASSPSDAACFPFKLPGDLQAEDVTGADLWLYREDPLPEDEPTTVTNASISIAQIDNWDLDVSFQRTSAIASQDVSGGDGWTKVDLVTTVRNWLDYNERTKMVQVTCTGCSTSNETVIASDASHRPFLIIYTNPVNKVRRPKRNVHCVPGMAECCRDNLFVSFQEIGWSDWILQPLGYQAYFCRGSCTSAASLASTSNNHNSIVRRLMQTGKNMDLAPCCTPTKYSSMQLIYVDSNNTLIQKTLPNMVVEACGCH